jgi:arylsulfatase A-like enzyme
MIRSLVLLAFVAVACPSCHTMESTPAKPNILFLFADDQRPDTVGAFGNEHIETPNLDRLVRGGFRFQNNYCMGSWSGAVCVPSRAMLMSGRSMNRVKANLEGVRTLPQALAEVGYVTYGTGKWHNRAPAFERSFQFGKNILMGGMADHTKTPVVDLDHESRKFSPRRTGEKFSSELFADAAIDYLTAHAKRTKDNPFFMYVAFSAPHDPRNPPVAYREKYYKKRPPVPPNFLPQVEWFGDRSWAGIRDEVLAPFPRTKEVIREQLAEYYGLITHMDDQIGRILKTLEETGQARNTIIVYAADHGLAVGSHGLVGKQNLYEHSMGCPLVFHGAGFPKGKTSKALTYLFDIYPTLCSLTGAKPDESVEGQNLMPVVRGQAKGVRDSIFTLYRATQRAVRDSRYKLIRYPEIDKTLLYDLQNDPHEMTDLSAIPAHGERLKKMWALLEAGQKWADDNQPLTVANPRPAKVDLSDANRPPKRKRKPDRWQPKWIREKYFGGGK